jgi:hypothetical protein
LKNLFLRTRKHENSNENGNTGCEGEFCRYGRAQGQNNESQPKSNDAIKLAMLLRGKKRDQGGAPKRKLKNLLLRTRKLENSDPENGIELERKDAVKKWSSKSNPSRLAWLLRLKKGNQNATK